VTFAQHVRRGLFWALTGGALAEFYVLGESRGWAIVAPISLRITALTLAAWFFHLLIHEAGHLIASRAMEFQVDSVTIGPIEWNARNRSWGWAGVSIGGKIGTLPIGAQGLRRRLRVVAAAGPAMTVLALNIFGALLVLTPATLTSPIGVATVTGGLVLLSAMTPGRFRHSTAVAGNDIDQIIGGRAVLAHWTYLAVVQGVLAGRRPRKITEGVDFARLTPGPDDAPEAITLICAVHHLERSDFTKAKAVLTTAARRAHDAPTWIHTDVFHQLGAIAALVDHDLDKAVECLTVVRRMQSRNWYGDLLEACIAQAVGDGAMADKRLNHWLDQARTAMGGRLAFGGNEWILDRLRSTWRDLERTERDPQ
jgi:hypothetical protein